MVAHPHDEARVERFTREEAVRIARAEAKRDYSEQADAIRYVAHIAAVQAFCLCEFVMDEGAWIKTYRLLTPAEWLADEAIEDQTIIDLARSGRIVGAVLLYRVKYGAGLHDGLVAVQGLIGGLSSNDA